MQIVSVGDNLHEISNPVFWGKKEKIFKKQDLIFHANCLHWRKFVYNVKSCFLGKTRKKKFNLSCAETLPSITICMKCQILFSRKNKKNIINLPSAENAQSGKG